MSYSMLIVPLFYEARTQQAPKQLTAAEESDILGHALGTDGGWAPKGPQPTPAVGSKFIGPRTET